MATNVFIAGVSHRGFRVPDNTGAWKTCKFNNIIQVNVDDETTKKILFRNKDNFIKVAASNSTTAAVQGLSSTPMRIRDQNNVHQSLVNPIQYQKITGQSGAKAATISLANGSAMRVIRRSAGRWIIGTGDSAKIRGIVAQQLGFDVRVATTGVLTSNNTNVSNADTVTIGSSVYTFKTALTEKAATGTITSNGTNVSNGDTVTVNGKVYTFQTTLTNVDGNIKIAATAALSMTNLTNAINGTGGVPGTDYAAATVANANVSASVNSLIVTVTALAVGTAGNAYTLAKSAATIALSGATLSGGVNSIANEIVIGGSADASLTNLASAINGSAGSGTTYSSATVTNTVVSSSTVTAHAITLTSFASGLSSVATTTTATTLSFATATLTGGIAKIYEGITATVDLTVAYNLGQLRRHFKSYVAVP